jgi:Protein of unknown function (DUF2800)
MAHSSIVGGSNAGRLINCPASFQATRALPPSADISSEYAEEGTAMHEVMTHLMTERRKFFNDGRARDWTGAARARLGKRFHDRDLTQEHIDTMIVPALGALADLEKLYGGGFKVVGVEQRVTFPGIAGAHGTCDLLLGNGTTVLHVDWKFGQGVGVKAVYRDERGDTVNAQLMFYTAGSMNTRKSLYRGVEQLGLAIIQPRSEEPLTHVAISREEIKWFVEDLQNAVIKAWDRDPPMQKGEWCRFAPCKVDCPLWTGAILDLSAIGKPPPVKLADSVTPYGEYLAKAKNLVDVLAMFKKEVDQQLHSYLEDGGLVPGWRLKDKTKQRQWIDDWTVADELERLGFDEREIWQRKLVTFQAADATAKRLGVVVPDRLRVAPQSTETTVAPIDDPAPIVDRRGAAEAFQTALKALTSGAG